MALLSTRRRPAQPCPLVRVACVKGVVRVTGEGRVSCDHSRDNWSRAAMANASTTGWDAGYAAIRDGKEVDELRKRLRAARRPDISYQYGRTASESKADWQGFTLLHFVVWKLHEKDCRYRSARAVEYIDFLLAEGCDASSQDHSGRTAAARRLCNIYQI